MSEKANHSSLPSMRDIAETLRAGHLDFDELCTLHDVHRTTLANRLRDAGYGISGHPLRVEARKTAVLQQGGIPVYVGGGTGGGDYQGLPLELVPHARRRREFLGLDWSTRPATGPRWMWV